MNTIVFSKDRACQLDLLLRSIEFSRVGYLGPQATCLVAASNLESQRAYEIVAKRFPWACFVEQNPFRAQLMKCVDSKHVLFLCDDSIFNQVVSWKREVEWLEALDNDPSLACVSLRLHPGVTECWAIDTPNRVPRMDDKLCFNWKTAEYAWGYPMSVDSHIFRTNDLLPLLRELPYNSPNTLEGALARDPLPQERMKCMERAVVYNIPQNTVQVDCKNRTIPNGIGTNYLNQAYLEGKQIRIEPLINWEGNAVYREVIYTLEKRS